jgi:hypothetical protein
VLRRALATIGSGPMEAVLALALPTFERYAQLHGYELVVGDGESLNRPPAWAKVCLLRRLLDEFDEVLWIDSDAIIMRDEIDLADEIDLDAYQAFSKGRGIHTESLLNSGVWYLRSCERSKDFIDAVWAQEHAIDHKWWEQKAILDLLGFDELGEVQGDSEWLMGTVWLHDAWNRCEYVVGISGDDRIRHYAGRSNDYRINRMKVDLAIASNDRDAWLLDILWRRKYPQYKLKRFFATPLGLVCLPMVTFFRKVRFKVRVEYRKLRGRATR